MGQLHDFKQRVWKKLNRKSDSDPGQRFRHSQSYHRYFRGYTEVRVPTERGKYRIERYYTAPWYVHRMSTAQWIGLKAGYCLLFLLSAGALAFAMLYRTVTSSAVFAAIPATLGLIGLVLLFGSLAELAAARRRMTVGVCQATDGPLKWKALYTAICFFAALLGKIVTVFVYMQGRLYAEELPSFVAMLVAALSCLAIYLVQRRVTYDTEENPTSSDHALEGKDGHQIL